MRGRGRGRELCICKTYSLFCTFFYSGYRRGSPFKKECAIKECARIVSYRDDPCTLMGTRVTEVNYKNLRVSGYYKASFRNPSSVVDTEEEKRRRREGRLSSSI